MRLFKSLILSASLFLAFTPLWGKSISGELQDYVDFCQSAAEDDAVFSTFKRSPLYRTVLEHVSYELGEEYLKTIVKEYPQLLSHFEQFRQNDAIGAPIVYDYGKWGSFSPTTLRYIKVLGDLIKEFGDLSKYHIVEIGGGYGGQCKILSDLRGFASYTIVDLPQCNALAKKYLQMQRVKNVSFVDATDLQDFPPADIVISNYAFSELDREGEKEYLERIIQKAPNGYMTLNFISSQFQLHSLTLEEIVAALFKQGKKGRVEKERPVSHHKNVIVTWRAPHPSTEIRRKRPPPLVTPIAFPQLGKGISYALSGGRLGDNLAAYLHAKWIAFQYNLPLITIPFPYSDAFCLDKMDRKLSEGFIFQHKVLMQNESDVISALPSSLVIVPFFSECPYDARWHRILFDVDWENEEFKNEVEKALQPKKPVAPLELPQDKITVGVHLRRGTGVDSRAIYSILPLKFPHESYYVEQIDRLSKIFENQKLYVFIFTDEPQPKQTVLYFENALNNPNIEFAYRPITGPYKSVIEDFVAMAQFDCFIRSQSNFSMMATKLGRYALLITPMHAFMAAKNLWIVDEVELRFDGTNPRLMGATGQSHLVKIADERIVPFDQDIAPAA